jgi:hypothetical protein
VWIARLPLREKSGKHAFEFSPSHCGFYQNLVVCAGIEKAGRLQGLHESSPKSEFAAECRLRVLRPESGLDRNHKRTSQSPSMPNESHPTFSIPLNPDGITPTRINIHQRYHLSDRSHPSKPFDGLDLLLSGTGSATTNSEGQFVIRFALNAESSTLFLELQNLQIDVPVRAEIVSLSENEFAASTAAMTVVARRLSDFQDGTRAMRFLPAT